MMAVALLVGAGLFVRSLIAVQYAPLGYDPSRVLIVNRFIPPGGFDAVQQATLREELLRAARALPTVESAAWMSSAPFVSTSWTDLHVPGLDNATALGPFTFQATTADYFKTMGTRIVRGRGLRADDTIGAPTVAVVSESMARTLWPGRDALGQCFRMRTTDSPCREVVGIAEDIVQRELAEGPRLHYYVPIDQYPRTFGNGLLIKLRDAPARAAEDVRVALQRALPAGAYLVAQPLADGGCRSASLLAHGRRDSHRLRRACADRGRRRPVRQRQLRHRAAVARVRRTDCARRRSADDRRHDRRPQRARRAHWRRPRLADCRGFRPVDPAAAVSNASLRSADLYSCGRTDAQRRGHRQRVAGVEGRARRPQFGVTQRVAGPAQAQGRGRPVPPIF